MSEQHDTLLAAQQEMDPDTPIQQIALEQAASWFEQYAENHTAKGTLDGDTKAKTNRERAEYLRLALRSPAATSLPDGVDWQERAFKAETALAAMRVPYLSDRAQFMAPADRQRPYFILRFDDADRRDVHFDNEVEARLAWEQYAPAWNCQMFATMHLTPAPAQLEAAGDVVEALISRAFTIAMRDDTPADARDVIEDLTKVLAQNTRPPVDGEAVAWFYDRPDGARGVYVFPRPELVKKGYTETPLCKCHPTPTTDAETQAKRDGMEEAAKVAEAERLEDPQPDTSDEAYEQAITDVVAAIRARALAQQERSQ